MSDYLKKKELLDAMREDVKWYLQDGPSESDRAKAVCVRGWIENIVKGAFDAKPATPKDQCLCGLCGKRGISPCPLWSDGTSCVKQNAKNM